MKDLESGLKVGRIEEGWAVAGTDGLGRREDLRKVEEVRRRWDRSEGLVRDLESMLRTDLKIRGDKALFSVRCESVVGAVGGLVT